MAKTPGTIEVDVDTVLGDGVRRMMLAFEIGGILTEVMGEIRKAREKHGDQMGLPIRSGATTRPLEMIRNMVASETLDDLSAHALAFYAKRATDTRAKSGDVDWTDITLEEVLEAFAEEPGTDAFEAECLQAAAMFVSMVQVSRRGRTA